MQHLSITSRCRIYTPATVFPKLLNGIQEFDHQFQAQLLPISLTWSWQRLNWAIVDIGHETNDRATSAATIRVRYRAARTMKGLTYVYLAKHRQVVDPHSDASFGWQLRLQYTDHVAHLSLNSHLDFQSATTRCYDLALLEGYFSDQRLEGKLQKWQFILHGRSQDSIADFSRAQCVLVNLPMNAR